MPGATDDAPARDQRKRWWVVVVSDQPTYLAPQWPIITLSGGPYAYSLGDDGFERGVYRHHRDQASHRALTRGWELIAPLPYVLARLESRDRAGGRQISYHLAPRPDSPEADTAVCTDAEIGTGRWPRALPRLDHPQMRQIGRITGTAIREIALSAPQHRHGETTGDNR
ncbi:MAG: hypothetical protein ACRD0H_25185 [Actinomycetes bacterium]